jgi:hypothetical protein
VSSPRSDGGVCLGEMDSDSWMDGRVGGL